MEDPLSCGEGSARVVPGLNLSPTPTGDGGGTSCSPLWLLLGPWLSGREAGEVMGFNSPCAPSGTSTPAALVALGHFGPLLWESWSSLERDPSVDA